MIRVIAWIMPIMMPPINEPITCPKPPNITAENIINENIVPTVGVITYFMERNTPAKPS